MAAVALQTFGGRLACWTRTGGQFSTSGGRLTLSPPGATAPAPSAVIPLQTIGGRLAIWSRTGPQFATSGGRLTLNPPGAFVAAMPPLTIIQPVPIGAATLQLASISLAGTIYAPAPVGVTLFYDPTLSLTSGPAEEEHSTRARFHAKLRIKRRTPRRHR